ncbi:MAG TPA: hypothetical protein PKE00_01300 [Planctomycetota bacterium]|nr:hypothetical protein [Planctomycetota bacterium]
MKDLGELLKGLLQTTSVVPAVVDEVVAEVARDLWLDGANEVRIVGMRRGVLRIEVDSHARYAEAKSFYAGLFLERIQQRMEIDPQRGTEHVHRIVFQVRGMN